jgi:hypothetical protein
MPKLNLEFILYSLKDVRETLDEIIDLAEAATLDEIDFRIKMEHAYHHLHFAWNIRHVGAKRSSECVADDFNRWSKFPEELEEYKS